MRYLALPSPSWHFGLLLALVFGAFLRLAWVEDMEYKADESWTYQRTLNAFPDDPHPWLGMPTSYELRHPSGTVYVFTALAWLFDAETPTELARACQITNVLAILLVALFAFFCVPWPDREYWLWGAALVAVNPIAVVMHRKIWPPSILPLFVMLFLIAYWHRGRRLGAFAWGLSGLLLAQIHPGGMFLSLGFAVWTFILQRKSARWRYWLVGSILGFLLLIPWLHYAFETMQANPISQRKFGNAFEFKFWIRWITESFGFSLGYSLEGDFRDFLVGPRIAGQPTGIAGLLHLILAGILLQVLVKLCLRAWPRRQEWRAFLRSADEPTRFTVLANMFGFGIVFTATMLPVHRHYMLLTFPLMSVGVAYTVLRWDMGRRVLVAIWCLNLAISTLFLLYIHQSDRPIRGEYGEPYRLRLERSRDGSFDPTNVPMPAPASALK